MIFLIDFENVNSNGFHGLEQLTETDKVILFYSEKSSSISISIHRKLEESKVGKEYIPIKTKGNLKTEVVKVLSGQQFNIEKICAIIEKHKTKQAINNALTKEFGSEKTGVIYKLIKPLLKSKQSK